MTDSSKIIALVAGETSGDILGAGLIRALKKQLPDARFVGIGGPLMIAEGFETLFPMDRLSVMGIVEVLGRLKELLRIRRTLRDKFLKDLPDIFIGIDAPDFNLPLERMLKEGGVMTMHYVSPSVWAWRKKRVLKIRDAVDHMLCLLPFETKVYADNNVPATFIGHPLADQIAMQPERAEARERLNIAPGEQVVGILPGSRGGEVKRLAPLFIAAAKQMLQQNKNLRFILPCANAQRRRQMEEFLQADSAELSVQLLDGQSHEVMSASNVLLMASGTAALEGLLHKTPMVISYKVNSLTYWILRKLVTIPWVSLPNILADRELVPELIQHDATPENLALETLKCLSDREKAEKQVEEFTRIHHLLKRDGSACAAEVVMDMLKKQREAKT